MSKDAIVIPNEPPVTSRPHRYSRHPNYLALVVEIACVPLIAGLWITALVFPASNAAVLAIRISAEERVLERDYDRAFGAVPRLLPGLRSG